MASKTYFHMYVRQRECLSIEDALGALRRYLTAHGVNSYVFTLASLNTRARRVRATVSTHDPIVASRFAAHWIEQDYPEENS